MEGVGGEREGVKKQKRAKGSDMERRKKKKKRLREKGKEGMEGKK